MRRAEVGAQVEEVVLNPGQHGVDLGPVGGMEPRQSDGGVGLVDGAVSGHAKLMLGHPAAVAQGGLPTVAAAGIDAGQFYHVQLPP